MTRYLYVPEENLPDFAAFFSLGAKQLATLHQIAGDFSRQSTLDGFLAIINGLGVPDDEAANIYGLYKYIVYTSTEKGVAPEAILSEAKEILLNSNLPNAEAAAKNIDDNRTGFLALFGSDSPERFALKRRFLSSQLYNTVTSLRSVCDLRPVFDPTRDTIREYLQTTYIEFTVTDSTGERSVIPLQLDDLALKKLKAEIEAIDKKHELLARANPLRRSV